MPPKHGKKEYTPHIAEKDAPPCQAQGCKQRGLFKAPKSKTQAADSLWFCLDHIREYNEKWDFFAGMTAAEIEAFRHDAITGHRPTWHRETRKRYSAAELQDILYEFIALEKKQRKQEVSLPHKVKKALAVMDMEYPFTTVSLKKTYRALVKKHHPDVNKSNKLSEEKFKKITESYHLLADYLKSNPY